MCYGRFFLLMLCYTDFMRFSAYRSLFTNCQIVKFVIPIVKFVIPIHKKQCVLYIGG
jgi:hypothetical protein